MVTMQNSAPTTSNVGKVVSSCEVILTSQWRPATTGLSAPPDREYNPLENSVFIWTETKDAGHTFVSVHENNVVSVHTYGRFGRIDQGGLTGDRILNFLKHENAIQYYRYEMYKMNVLVFIICLFRWNYWWFSLKFIRW